MARKCQAGGESPRPQPEVWIQYKAKRARELQTTTGQMARSRKEPVLLDEFQADLRALLMSVAGVPMDDIRIVWGTGQIRATYTFRTSVFCDTIKYLVRRACTTLSDTLAERSISCLFYAEGGTPLSMGRLPTAPPIVSASQRSPPSIALPSGSSDSQPPAAVSSEASQFYHPKQPYDMPHPHPPAGAFTIGSSISVPPSHRQTLDRQTDKTLPTPTSDLPTQSINRWQFPTPSQCLPHSSVVQGPQILPPIFLSRRDAPQGAGSLPLHTYTTSPETPLNPLKAPAAARASGVPGGIADPQPTHMCFTVSLTSGTCARLRNSVDDAVLSLCPIVRLLVLRPVNPGCNKAYEVFITDGNGYTWIALASALSMRVGDGRYQAQVGSTVRLKAMSRLSRPEVCDVLVHDMELVENSVGAASPADHSGSSSSKTINLSTTPTPPSMGDGGHFAANTLSLSHSERAGRLLAEAKLQQERRRRILLEQVLADVCLDLDRRNVLTPAMLDALQRLDELADTAMLID